MERVVHFEIPSDDPRRAMEFYTNVFGWTFSQFPGNEYWLVKTGADSPGIDGGIMKKRDANQPMVNTIEVVNLDASLKRIVQFGGTIVVEKFPIPELGFQAFFKDADGHIFGVIEPIKR